VWDEAKQIYLYTKGDQSVLILLYGVDDNPADDSYDFGMERNPEKRI
jgi:carbohydrate ABC transporter membrane protein 1, CUT1 family (TC 3.A.1.1.-)